MNELSLDEQMAAYDNDGQWEILEIFKQTEDELTQKVAKRDGGCSSDVFIRKEFSENSRQGFAYEKVWEEQQKGRFLKGCPKIVDYYEYGCLRVSLIAVIIMMLAAILTNFL